jgi:hypothetical protein
MIKTLLLNDTSEYHSGSKQCIKVINEYYNPIHSVYTDNLFDISQIKYFDRVILNGEGTLHDNQPNAVKFLTYLQEAQKLNKETLIINSVWQNMDLKWIDLLKKCSLIEVREILSQKEIFKNFNIISNIILDISIHSDIPYKEVKTKNVCVGGSFYGSIVVDWNSYTKVDIFNISWESLVNIFRSTKLVITGRHHEMYAALKARTPVIVAPGNTWKNEAFFYTIGCNELLMPPTKKNIQSIIDGKYDLLWQKAWNYLDQYQYKYM